MSLDLEIQILLELRRIAIYQLVATIELIEICKATVVSIRLTKES